MHILLVHPVIKNVVNCCTFKNSCLTQLGYQTYGTVAFMKQLAFPSSINLISVTQEVTNKLDNLNSSHSCHLNGTMTFLLNSTILMPFHQNKNYFVICKNHLTGFKFYNYGPKLYAQLMSGDRLQTEDLKAISTTQNKLKTAST